jgi:hypothetical protein
MDGSPRKNRKPDEIYWEMERRGEKQVEIGKYTRKGAAKCRKFRYNMT